MRHGFIRTAAVTPKIHVADTKGNGAETIRLAREAAEHGAKMVRRSSYFRSLALPAIPVRIYFYRSFC